MTQQIYLGLLMGLYTAIITAVYLHFRVNLPKTDAQGNLETAKWVAWLFIGVVLPIVSMDLSEEYFYFSTSPYPDRGTVLMLWVLIWVGFIIYRGVKSWFKGELKVIGAGGHIIYEGRKREPDN